LGAGVSAMQVGPSAKAAIATQYPNNVVSFIDLPADRSGEEPQNDAKKTLIYSDQRFFCAFLWLFS
jgi:hypothetical protein